MNLSLLSVVAFAISLCSANEEFVCQLYDEESKSLQIFCDRNRQPLPPNCLPEIPSTLNPSNVIHLKIDQCDEHLLRSISEKYQNIQRLDLSYSKYPSINWTGIAFANVYELNAQANELTAIPAEALKNFPKLSALDLSQNRLTNISADDFENVPKTTKINLSSNELASIDANAFAKLTNLKSLNLRNNRFTALPVLNKLTATEIDFQENLSLSTFDCTLVSTIRPESSWLNLTWHHVTSFRGDQDCRKRKIVDIKVRDGDGIHITPIGLELILSNEQNLKNLQTFVAGDRSFVDVKNILRFLGPAVAKLDLTGNNVSELNTTVFERFSNLQELILSDTALKVFDFDSIYNRNSLNRLDISKNQLKMVKNTELLPRFGNLIELNAAGNEIKNAHEILKKLPSNIQRLNLAGNHVGHTYAFDTFARCIALEYLNLSDTNLSILDANAFLLLRHLNTLDLSHNNLNDIDLAIHSQHLKELRLANSKITNVSEIITNLSPTVELLDLSGNNIESSINLTSIQTLSGLTHLNLSGTHLRKFNLESLLPLNISTIDISNNQLQSIDLGALKNFTQLKQLYLNGNYLTKLDINELALSPFVGYAISKNNFSCMYLKHLNQILPYMTFIGNELDQRHGEDCQSSTQAIGDFLSSVYDKVKFW